MESIVLFSTVFSLFITIVPMSKHPPLEAMAFMKSSLNTNTIYFILLCVFLKSPSMLNVSAALIFNSFS